MIDDAPPAVARDLLPLFPEYSSVGPDGELAIGGVGVRELAERFGTPAYIVDEAGLRYPGPAAEGADPDHPRRRAGHPRVAVHRRRRLQVRAAPGPGPRGHRPDRVKQQTPARRAAPAHRVADPGHRAFRPGGRGGRRAR